MNLSSDLIDPLSLVGLPQGLRLLVFALIGDKPSTKDTLHFPF